MSDEDDIIRYFLEDDRERRVSAEPVEKKESSENEEADAVLEELGIDPKKIKVVEKRDFTGAVWYQADTGMRPHVDIPPEGARRVEVDRAKKEVSEVKDVKLSRAVKKEKQRPSSEEKEGGGLSKFL